MEEDLIGTSILEWESLKYADILSIQSNLSTVKLGYNELGFDEYKFSQSRAVHFNRV